MRRGFRGIRMCGPFIAAIVAVLALAACGSSSGSGASGNAQSLLKQTFSSDHSVKSGVLGFDLTVNPTGSSTLSTPITLSVSGPFQSRGSGKLPQSDLTIGITALGQKGSLGVISTGTAGYVSLQGVNYQLPAGRLPEAPAELLLHRPRPARRTRAWPAGHQPAALVDAAAIVGTETVEAPRPPTSAPASTSPR